VTRATERLTVRNARGSHVANLETCWLPRYAPAHSAMARASRGGGFGLNFGIEDRIASLPSRNRLRRSS
jgi:hypothetical protein